MGTEKPQPITELLVAVGQGDGTAKNRLWQLVYDEFHHIARRQIARENVRHARRPTSLIHEAYLRMTADQDYQWNHRRHFFAAAAKAMRRICTDDARTRARLKRGGDARRTKLSEEPCVSDRDPAEVMAVEEALSKLEQADPLKAEIVALRYFGGMSIDETAAALDLSPRKIDKEWAFAKAWLYRELAGGTTGES